MSGPRFISTQGFKVECHDGVWFVEDVPGLFPQPAVSKEAAIDLADMLHKVFLAGVRYGKELPAESEAGDVPRETKAYRKRVALREKAETAAWYKKISGEKEEQ